MRYNRSPYFELCLEILSTHRQHAQTARDIFFLSNNTKNLESDWLLLSFKKINLLVAGCCSEIDARQHWNIMFNSSPVPCHTVWSLAGTYVSFHEKQLCTYAWHTHTISNIIFHYFLLCAFYDCTLQQQQQQISSIHLYVPLSSIHLYVPLLVCL